MRRAAVPVVQAARWEARGIAGIVSVSVALEVYTDFYRGVGRIP
jgi:hypothetical protein